MTKNICESLLALYKRHRNCGTTTAMIEAQKNKEGIIILSPGRKSSQEINQRGGKAISVDHLGVPFETKFNGLFPDNYLMIELLKFAIKSEESRIKHEKLLSEYLEEKTVSDEEVAED